MISTHAGAWVGCTTNQTRKEPEMAYKKPQIVAKSEPKQSYVAGCPENRVVSVACVTRGGNSSCYMGPAN